MHFRIELAGFDDLFAVGRHLDHRDFDDAVLGGVHAGRFEVEEDDRLTTGIGIAAGILPALGFAQLINMIMNKKVAVFFLLGFLLSAYMGISTVGIVCFSVVIVGILLIVKDFVPNQPALQGGMDDDNEF